MSSERTLNTILHLVSICLALGRPPLSLNSSPRNYSGNLEFPASRIKSQSPYKMHQTLLDEKKGLHKSETQILEASETVQSLPAKSCIVEDNRWSVTFDMTSIYQGDVLQLAELHVNFPSFHIASKVIVEIFHTKNRESSILLGSVAATMPVSRHSTWESFNVTNMMKQHLQWGKRMINHKVMPAKKKPPSAHVVASHSKLVGKSIKDDVLQKISTNKAFIIFFSKKKQFSKTESPALTEKLSASSNVMTRFRSQRRKRYNQKIVAPTNTFPLAKEQQPLCRKVDMIVDFKKFGWDNWILYPKNYNAYRCEGTCHAPLKDTAKITNYDYIKSLNNMKEWERVECSSCVPVKMEPLTMLLHEDLVLILRHHNDMIVEECGAL